MTIGARAATATLALAALVYGVVSARAMEGQTLGQVVSLIGSAYAAGEPRRRELNRGVPVSQNMLVWVDAGSELTVVYAASGDRYIVLGPSVIRFQSDGPELLSGEKPQRSPSVQR